jgi:hypothetical protein
MILRLLVIVPESWRGALGLETVYLKALLRDVKDTP